MQMCELGKLDLLYIQNSANNVFSPLPPGACHNVQLEFLTLSTGLVGLAAVHVIDLDRRETTQITELPDIMVSK
jgi:hypothetical protein